MRNEFAVKPTSGLYRWEINPSENTMTEQAAVAEQEQQQAESAAQATETEQAAASAAAEQAETQPEQQAGDGQKPPEKGGVQRRIDELTKARRLAEAEAEFWRKKALGEPAPPKAAEDKEPKEPNPDDFQTTAEYLKAVREYDRETLRKELRAEVQKIDQQREQRTEAEVLAETWAEKETATQEKHADYDEVTAVAFDTLGSATGNAKAAIAHAIQYSENGPEILYYLGQHPEDVKKLAALHPTQALLALGKLEGRLANDTKGGEEQPPQTRAPKPPTPLKRPAVKDDGELRDDLAPGVWQERFLKKLENSKK